MRVRPEYDFKVIGNNLKKLRLENHMSVEEVRSYMQLGTVQTIYKWKRGDGLPQADTLLALMQLYGADRVQMITGEGAELSSVRILGEIRLGAFGIRPFFKRQVQ